MTGKITWNTEDVAVPCLIPVIIEDMGIGEEDPTGKAIKATTQYMEHIIKEWNFPTIGDVQVAAHHFYDGYLAGALKS